MENHSKNQTKFYLGLLGIILFFTSFFYIIFPTLILELTDETQVSLLLINLLGGIDEEITLGINPLAITFYTLLVVSFILYCSLFIVSFKKDKDEKAVKACNILAYIDIGFLLVCLLFYIILPFTFTYVVNGDISRIDSVEFNEISLIFFLVLDILIVLIVHSFVEKKEGIKFDVFEIVELSMMVALALVLDKIRIGVGQTGGSINLAPVPLMIYSFRHGLIKGIVASSIVFGFLSCLVDGYGFQTYPFDYFIGFLGYGSCSIFYYILKLTIFKEKDELFSLITSSILGVICLFIIRMMGSTLSSMILYQYELGPALLYNVPYIGPSCLGTVIVICLLTPFIKQVNHRYKTKYLKTRFQNLEKEEVTN